MRTVLARAFCGRGIPCCQLEQALRKPLASTCEVCLGCGLASWVGAAIWPVWLGPRDRFGSHGARMALRPCSSASDSSFPAEEHHHAMT